MNALARPAPEDPGLRLTPQLRTVLLTDLADSTALVERLGDVRAASLWQRLDLRTRDLLEFTGGRLIDKSDGLLALFDRPVRAVDFALRYQRLLQELGAEEGIALRARVGIHVGELVTWENPAHAVAAGAKPLEVEGLAKPVAARLMSLALPGQVLLSGMAQTLAQRAQGELGDRAGQLRWLVHGRYRFKGVPAPMVVHEVGEPGLSPLRQPPSSPKGWREVPLWRRPPVLALEAALVLAVVGGSMFSLFRSPPALAFHERDWVVVGDMSNFTDDPRLEQSLDTALRVSLEQSQYVNVVPELKMQATLERMGRSENTTVDRAIGSEIALREGARALLLPSVAEVGGRLRVNVEVVDPNTQVTVYAQTAEGRGAESALASLDRVTSELREKLGESLGDIQGSSKPLADATTRNLDALRAFSLAREARLEKRGKDAMALLKRATDLDPEFGLAYADSADLALLAGDIQGAHQAMDKALALKERLTERDKLRIDGRRAMYFAPPADAMQRFRTLATVYPDEFDAYYQYGFLAWYSANAYRDGLDFIAPAYADANPARSHAYYLSGVLNMALGNFPQAAAAFDRYRAMGAKGYLRQYAELYAAQRDYGRARALLQGQTQVGFKYTDFDQRLDEVLFPLDQGQWRTAQAAMGELLKASADVAPMSTRTYRAMSLYLDAIGSEGKSDADLRAFIESQIAQRSNDSELERPYDDFMLLMAGVMAAESGVTSDARRAMQVAGGSAMTSGQPSLINAAVMLRAELEMADGSPEKAVDLIRRFHQGNEIYFSHVVLMRAASAAGNWQLARDEADWLASHRGLAFAERNMDNVLTPANVAYSNLALLDGAVFAARDGQPDEAAKRLAAFRKAWPDGDRLEFLKPRLQQLRQPSAITSSRAE